MNGFATLDDVRDVEKVPLAERDLPQSTYETLRRGAAIDPEAAALHFIFDPEHFEEPLYEHPAVALAAAVGRPEARVGEVAYVELHAGASVSEQDLLAFARRHIGERAAVPKAIRIVETVPLTAVGKIFKPELVRREIEDVLTRELAAIESVAVCEVEALAHRIYGTEAHVRLEGASGVERDTVEEDVRRVLGNYAVRYKLAVSS